jgi:hypothetical protein
MHPTDAAWQSLHDDRDEYTGDGVVADRHH